MPVKYRPEQQATVQSQMMKQYAAAAVPGNQPGNHYAYVEQKQRYHGDQSMPQDLCQQMANDKDKRNDQDKQEGEYSGQQQQQQQQQQVGGQQQVSAWQTLAAPGSAVADYLSHLTPSTLHLSLNHFLKYSAESIKKEAELPAQPPGPSGKKKKKKKAAKEKKPRPKPGEIRLTTALDGSTLFCCPECNIAYPDKELLEQHLLGHTLERRFVCDICGAGLKRKDHLTRHKQSHNPERPYVCTVCLKAFKRKEQLTLHFVIHSGEKRHVCSECGKGFYRKDHLRKHTRSHIARRVKAELSQGGGAMQGGGDMS